MSAGFPLLSPETAYVRKVLFALEVLDGVTLTRISRGLEVNAIGLVGKPIVNASGLFVWLPEGNRVPQGIEIDPRGLPYMPASRPAATTVVPVPPLPDLTPPFFTEQLAPRGDYAFPAGVMGLRARLVQARNANPPAPLAGASVWLRWVDDHQAANVTTWMDAPLRTTTDRNGDFVAVLRLAPSQLARPSDGTPVRARLRADNAGVVHESADFTLATGRITAAAFEQPPLPAFTRPFAWDEFQ
jgi:hypothetical protein